MRREFIYFSCFASKNAEKIRVAGLSREEVVRKVVWGLDIKVLFIYDSAYLRFARRKVTSSDTKAVSSVPGSVLVASPSWIARDSIE